MIHNERVQVDLIKTVYSTLLNNKMYGSELIKADNIPN